MIAVSKNVVPAVHFAMYIEAHKLAGVVTIISKGCSAPSNGS